MKLMVRCNQAPTSEGQWPLLRMCEISDTPGLQIAQYYRGALFMGATDQKMRPSTPCCGTYAIYSDNEAVEARTGF